MICLTSGPSSSPSARPPARRRQLPSSEKILFRGQKRPICEPETGDADGCLFETSCLPRSDFSKSSSPKLTPHISPFFVHGAPFLRKKARWSGIVSQSGTPIGRSGLPGTPIGAARAAWRLFLLPLALRIGVRLLEVCLLVSQSICITLFYLLYYQ